ncbi:MAG: hypothetical protein IPK26_30635 [Planctomycetes bacterium]|nr:hypothetical protein [Planctomycetota bacterium]
MTLTLASTGLMLGAGELLMRLLDGYPLTAWTLPIAAGRVTAADDLPADLVGPFLAQSALAPARLDPAWFRSSPPPVPIQPTPGPIAERLAAGFDKVFALQWNETLIRGAWTPGKGLSIAPTVGKPDSFYVFLPPPGPPSPRYRYPLSTTLPTGLTTNAFGFRGRQLPVDKPPAVVRIACVGASTTADDHSLPHSYPELLEHFLRTWAAGRGLPVTFEVLNAGCEGYYSFEAAATVQHWVLPLCVDYVLYYEGANQLHSPQVRRHVHIDEPTPPPPGPPASVAPGFWSRHSALARRLQSVLVRGVVLTEPAKPKQTLLLPAGLEQPDLTRAAEVADLASIFGSLEAIRTALAPGGARLVLSSFRWFVRDGQEHDPIRGYWGWDTLNNFYWPIRYGNLRALGDLQNRWFAAWAKAHDVDFVDVAAVVPEDGRLYSDHIHNTRLGARCHAWAACALLVPLLERDLQSGRIPVIDSQPDVSHPNCPPMRLLHAAELDAGR